MRTTILWFVLAWASAVQAASPLDQVSHRDKFYALTAVGDEIFVVGYPGLMFHSPDRGKTWQSLDPGTTNALYDITLNAKGQGIIVGRSGLVLTSSDGGKTWRRQDSQTKSHLFAVALTDSGQAWAVGHFGQILHSADAGKTWSEQTYDATLPPPPEGEEDSPTAQALSMAELENEGAVEEARLNDVTFIDDQRGWIAGEFGLVLVTTDGGQTWKRQRAAAGKLLFGILALDDTHLVAYGAEGTLMQTIDGGERWEAIEIDTPAHLFAACRQGDGLALAGQDGLVFHRAATGAIDDRRTGRYVWLNDVLFLGAKTGFAAGGRGHLLMTEDGGATWRRLAGR